MPPKRMTMPSEKSTLSGTTTEANARRTTPNSVPPTRTSARLFGLFPVVSRTI
jgi:hypothetical protein